MKYAKIQQAQFIDRPNRFIARVDIEGRVETGVTGIVLSDPVPILL